MTRPSYSRRAIVAAAAVVCVVCGHARAQMSSELESRSAFRVCADPGNLPYSNDQMQGFENKIADLIAQDLGVPVKYTWFPQVIGFVRNTLIAQKCDVVIGTVSGAEMMDTTNPYYHTGYMLVTREADGIKSDTLADPIFATKRIGLIAGTPPVNLVLQHDLMGNATSYDLTVDTRVDQPNAAMLQDLVDDKIDVALIWGPFAGYNISHEHLKLRAVFLSNEGNPIRLDYHIAMGVRPTDTEWRRKLNSLITRDQPKITAILQSYGIPMLDEQNRPIPASPATTQ